MSNFVWLSNFIMFDLCQNKICYADNYLLICFLTLVSSTGFIITTTTTIIIIIIIIIITIIMTIITIITIAIIIIVIIVNILNHLHIFYIIVIIFIYLLNLFITFSLHLHKWMLISCKSIFFSSLSP